MKSNVRNGPNVLEFVNYCERRRVQKSARRHRKNSGGRTIHTFKKEEDTDNELVKDPPSSPKEDIYYAVSSELP